MSEQSHRLAEFGSAIDRSRTIEFSFDGQVYAGSSWRHIGVRTAGQWLTSERGAVLSITAHAASTLPALEEPNALVTLGRGGRTEPNIAATTVELYDGLEAHSQNRWPSLRFDVMAINSLFKPLFSAGFYYKTFMWPRSFWYRLYEPMIRRAAGLGALLQTEPDPDHV